jgi:hypothetical protein
MISPDEHPSQQPRASDEAMIEAPADLARYLRGRSAETIRTKQYFGCDYLYQSITFNSNGMVHPCCYVVSPSHAVRAASDGKDGLRNNRVMTSSRALFAKLASGSQEPIRGYDPCVGCDVTRSTHGHVVTQSSFDVLFEYLLGERKMLR